MARIRSIKPDFFTSETIARLPISARLTFIGLWTHVDDNGVCVLNEMLITAALYPLDDPPEALRRITEDLRSLSGESLVRLYRSSGKRYLFITSWDEHQKISHPRKARYPRPDEPGCEPLTCENANPPEPLRKSSGATPEERRSHSALSREQGAGSRDKPLAPADANARKTQRPRDELWDALMAACQVDTTGIPKSARGAYNTAVADLRQISATPAQITLRARRYRQRWPNASLTPTALARRWGELADGTRDSPADRTPADRPARDVLADLDRRAAEDHRAAMEALTRRVD